MMQRYLRARSFADQVVVDGRKREQTGNGRVFFVNAAIGKDQQRVARFDGQRRAAA